MPNQNPTQDPQSVPVNPTDNIPVQTDLPPLPPDFQNVPEDQPINDSGSAAPPDSDLPPIIATPKKKFGGGKIIATILGIFLLVGGVGTGVYLVRQQQTAESRAWVKLTDPMTGEPTGRWSNDPEEIASYRATLADNDSRAQDIDSSERQAAQKQIQSLDTSEKAGCVTGIYGKTVCATKYVDRYDPDTPLPGVNSGFQAESDALYGCGAGNYHEGANGNLYCGQDSGDGGGGSTTTTVVDTGVACENVKVFKGESPTALTSTELTALKSGDAISFCAFPAASTNPKKVIFTINGIAQSAVTPVDACMTARGSCFCMPYTIPEGVSAFNIIANLYSQ